MLKTVSSITNAIGALNYKGTWDANTNSPALASGVGTKGDYYVVSVAGTTALNGISNWGIGDWVAFNGIAWQRVEGGADLNGVNLSVSNTSTLDGNVTFKDNLTQGTAAKGVNFTANTPAAGMTSQLLNWYEEGTCSLTVTSITGTLTSASVTALYTRVGRSVLISGTVTITNNGTGGGGLNVAGLPFTPNGNACGVGREAVNNGATCAFMVSGGSTTMTVQKYDNTYPVATGSTIQFSVSYTV